MGVVQENYNNVKEYNAYDENQYHIYYAGGKRYQNLQITNMFCFYADKKKIKSKEQFSKF